MTFLAVVLFATGALMVIGWAKVGEVRRVVDVRDFGALGDGRTDDTEAIQAAIDAVQ